MRRRRSLAPSPRLLLCCPSLIDWIEKWKKDRFYRENREESSLFFFSTLSPCPPTYLHPTYVPPTRPAIGKTVVYLLLQSYDLGQDLLYSVCYNISFVAHHLLLCKKSSLIKSTFEKLKLQPNNKTQHHLHPDKILFSPIYHKNIHQSTITN